MLSDGNTSFIFFRIFYIDKRGRATARVAPTTLFYKNIEKDIEDDGRGNPCGCPLF
jgi:hypothetical protein